MKYYGDIELISGEIINLKINEVDTININDTSKVRQLVVYNGELYFNDGTTFRVLQFSDTNTSSPLVSSLGDWFNDDLSFNPTPFNEFDSVSGLNAESSLLDVLTQMDAAITGVTQDAIGDLNNVLLTSLVDGDILLNVSDNFVNINLAEAISNYGNITILNCNDFDTSATLQNNDLIGWDSTEEKFTNKRCFYRYSSNSSETQYIITHNLGKRFCIVEVFSKTSNEKINDYTVTYNTTSQLTVTLAVAAVAEIVIFALD